MRDDDETPDIPPALRVVLIQWRRARITEANELSRLLGLPPVRTSRARKKDGDGR